MNARRKYVVDRYHVHLYSDMADSIKELGEIAIDEARERARLYCIPANWTATLIAGSMETFNVEFLVTRTRFRRNTNAS